MIMMDADTYIIRGQRPGLSLAQKELLKNKRYAPATGVQADFEKVLMLFVETKSVRYEDFANIWREKKLSLICAGRQSEREAKEFMEECMAIALKMFLPPYGFQARVGALYLLYGLYYTQPCHPKVQIRVTKEAWQHVMTLQKDLEKQNHHDTNYVFFKLVSDRAFTFCFVLIEKKGRFGSETYADLSKYDVRSSALTEDKQTIDELFSDEVFEQLQLIHSQYHQLKVKLAGPDSTRPDRSLDVLQDKFPNAVVDQLEKHHDRAKKREMTQPPRRKNRSDYDGDYDGNSEDEDNPDPEYQPSRKTVGQRRAALKKQAYTGAKHVQRRRHRNLVVESAAIDSVWTSPKKGRMVGRPRKVILSSSLDDLPPVTFAKDAQQSVKGGELQDGTLLSMPQLEEADALLRRKLGQSTKSTSTGQGEMENDRDGDDVVMSQSYIRTTVSSEKSTNQEDDIGDCEELAEENDKATEKIDSEGDNDIPPAATPKRRGRPPKQKDTVGKMSTMKQSAGKSTTPKQKGTPGETSTGKQSPGKTAAPKQNKNTVEEDIVPTRKRGRPPKSAKMTFRTSSKDQTAQPDADDKGETGPSPAIRKRGRPPKSTPEKSAEDQTAEVNDDESEPTPAKKKRGRPPKTKITPRNSTEEQMPRSFETDDDGDSIVLDLEGGAQEEEEKRVKKVGRPSLVKKTKGPVVRPTQLKIGNKEQSP